MLFQFDIITLKGGDYIKLNHDYVRSILLFVEESETNSFRSQKELLDFSKENNISKDELIYILQKLQEAEFINASFISGGNKIYMFEVKTITWKGHEYLDNIRDGRIWKMVKSSTSALASVSLSIMGELAKNKIIDYLS